MANRIPSPRALLSLEHLEARETPAVTYMVYQGTLTIEGTSGNDRVAITTNNRGTYYLWDNGSYVRSFTGSQIYKSTISFEGYAGHDYFQNDTALVSRAEGGSGNDILIGGSRADYLWGEDGADSLYGRGGNDSLRDGGLDTAANYFSGGSGNDYLYGGGGPDRMYGGNDHDYLYGYGGNDRLFGEYGKDFLAGGFGDDILDGGVRDGYSDTLEGGYGADWFRNDWRRVSGRWINDTHLYFTSSEGDRRFDYYS